MYSLIDAYFLEGVRIYSNSLRFIKRNLFIFLSVFFLLLLQNADSEELAPKQSGETLEFNTNNAPNGGFSF